MAKVSFSPRFHRTMSVALQVAVTAGLIFATSLTQPAAISAAQSSGDKESITLSPTTFKFTTNAGTSVDGKITIVNDGTTAYDFIVYARPYSISNNQYDSPNFTSAPSNADLYNWVSFSQTKYHLEANTVKEIAYRINVPTGAAPGGHYGVIFAETQPSGSGDGQSAVIRKKRVGQIIYGTVNGKVSLAGDSVAVATPSWQTEPPLTVPFEVKNTGNTDFIDTVGVTVRDIFGNVKYQTTKDYYVLPGTTRSMQVEWDGAAWFGIYRVEKQQSLLDKTEKGSLVVLVMPRYVPILLLVIVAIGVIYAILRRKGEKK